MDNRLEVTIQIVADAMIEASNGGTPKQVQRRIDNLYDAVDDLVKAARESGAAIVWPGW